MNIISIGSLILNFRENAGMTRPQLSKHICTEKYLYLIEKGQRTPSTEILYLLSMRLGVDLYEYTEYSECQDPVTVCEMMKQFNNCLATSDYTAMNRLLKVASEMADFSFYPLKYYLHIAKAANMAFVNGDFKGTLKYLQPIFEQFDPKYIETDAAAMISILIGSCQLSAGDFEGARETIEFSNKIADKLAQFYRFRATVISARLHKMTFLNFCGKYDDAIKTGLEIIKRNDSYCGYNNSNFIYFYLSYSYYKKNLLREAIFWYVRCLNDLVLYERRTAAKQIFEFELFYDMFSSTEICSYLKENIITKYGDFLVSKLDGVRNFIN